MTLAQTEEAAMTPAQTDHVVLLSAMTLAQTDETAMTPARREDVVLPSATIPVVTTHVADAPVLHAVAAALAIVAVVQLGRAG